MGALDFLKAVNDDLKAKHQFSLPPVLDGPAGGRSVFDGREVINLSSNNYLGFANHPKLKEAAVAAVRTYGVGTGAVRTIAGTMRMHRALEEKIAAFKHTESALLFQSGFAANAGTVSAVLDKESVIISDRLNHASIIDGARLSGAEKVVFEHADTADLAVKLAAVPAGRRTLVITDGVFSMDGDIGPLDKIVETVGPRDVILMVDDAHASGVLGRKGSGTVDHFNLHGRFHIQVGTLSKAIGAVGGYVAGSRELTEFLLQRGRPQLFSTTLPPAVIAACDAAFDLLQSDDSYIARLWDNAGFWRTGLKQLGFDDGNRSATPIVPVMVGEEAKAVAFQAALFEAGVFAKAIYFPTVARGAARVRTIVSADHSRDDLSRALDVFNTVGRRMGIV